VTNARASSKVVGQKGSPGVMLHVPRSANVKEWTFTLPKELPLWELESQWTLECLKRDCRGQTLMD